MSAFLFLGDPGGEDRMEVVEGDREGKADRGELVDLRVDLDIFGVGWGGSGSREGAFLG